NDFVVVVVESQQPGQSIFHCFAFIARWNNNADAWALCKLAVPPGLGNIRQLRHTESRFYNSRKPCQRKDGAYNPMEINHAAGTPETLTLPGANRIPKNKMVEEMPMAITGRMNEACSESRSAI